MLLSRLMCGVGLAAIASAGLASETITYTYDAKGRLVQVSRSGSVNNGVVSAYAYDKADNRSNVTTSGSAGGAPPSPSPSPTPTPSPTNQPPVPGTIAAQSIPRCTSRTVMVTTGATDPENNLPITVVAASNANPSRGGVTVISSTAVSYEAYSAVGADTVTFTLRDSLGATANGTFSVGIANAVCN